MLRAQLVFEQWQERLEADAQFYGMRLFDPAGGAVWRNAAARRYYEARGFFGAPVMAWDTIKVYLSAAEIRRLETIWQRAFDTGEPIEDTHTAQAPGHPPCTSVTRFYAIYGTIEHGVLLTHLQPLPCAALVASLSAILPRDRVRG